LPISTQDFKNPTTTEITLQRFEPFKCSERLPLFFWKSVSYKRAI